MHKWSVLLLIVLMVGLAGSPSMAQDDRWDRIREDYPRVDGSTSTQPLQQLLACNVYQIACLWAQYPEMSAERFIIPSYFSNVEEDIATQIMSVRHNGTHGSYVNLIMGETDFILVAREPSADELELAASEGVTLDVQPVAWDAFVFLLNAENPAHSLSLKQIQAIYTGEITNWRSIDPRLDQPITPYQRNPNSGSQELMLSMVMGDLDMIEAPDMILESMMGPINIINEDQWGIGYSVYYYTMFINRGLNIKLAAVDGVYPNRRTISDGTYPLASPVYVVLHTDLTEGNTAFLLREYLISDWGDWTIQSSGYIPYTMPQ